jgi:hypothetical protein
MLVTLMLVDSSVFGSVKVTVTGQKALGGTVTVIWSDVAPGGTTPELESAVATSGSLLACQLKSPVDDASLVMNTRQTVGSPVSDSHPDSVFSEKCDSTLSVSVGLGVTGSVVVSVGRGLDDVRGLLVAV